MRYDVFISYAREDKDVARSLATELMRRGIRVWFDETELSIGDSLRRSIDRGLSGSLYGIVILSRNYFEKEWPNRELDGLISLDDGSRKIILPVWHNLSRDQVAEYSPTLADKLGVSTSYGIDHVADEIERAIRTGSPRGIAAVISTNDPVASIRATVLTASDRHDLIRCLFELEEYLSRHPYNAEARLLKNTVEQAIHYESTRPSMFPPMMSRTSSMRRATTLFILLFAVSIGIVAYKYYQTSLPREPTQPPSIEFAASPEGDQVSLKVASTRTLHVQLSWMNDMDLDLSVQTPSSVRISYEHSVTADGALDRDILRGPGVETINIPKIMKGTYHVVVHNYTERGSPEFQLSVYVNGKAYRLYHGKLSESRTEYVLNVELRE